MKKISNSIYNKIKNKIHKKEEGFTIIETLVAITILMIAIAGPLTIAQKGLMASIYARDQVTASYLAQDVMEYMKNLRDRNVGDFGDFRSYIYGGDQTDDGVGGLAAICTTFTPCLIDSSGTGFVAITDTNSDMGLYLPTTGLYRPIPSATPVASLLSSPDASAKKTIFSRKFYVDTNSVSNGSDEATYVVEVDWQSSGSAVSNAVKIQDQVFNIQL